MPAKPRTFAEVTEDMEATAAAKEAAKETETATVEIEANAKASAELELSVGNSTIEKEETPRERRERKAAERQAARQAEMWAPVEGGWDDEPQPTHARQSTDSWPEKVSTPCRSG